MVVISSIMTVKRAASQVGGTTTVSAAITFMISRDLVLNVVGGRAHGFAIVWLVPVMTDKALSTHLAPISLACTTKVSFRHAWRSGHCPC